MGERYLHAQGGRRVVRIFSLQDVAERMCATEDQAGECEEQLCCSGATR